ncbi:MAG: hypothetical protein NTY35_10555 [Planctomycetota bacterium]|nr:hypothetical protein [Planctomycetota bacterium]
MILVTLLLALGQQQQSPQQGPPAQAEAPVFARARDPFVFRCVLDKRVRIVTLALSDELWAAYDTRTCGFYKAWKGGVKFDGAVYTTVHGPTPTSRGADYAKGLEGDVWVARVGDQPSEARAEWRGYRLENGTCVLLYDVVLKDGRAIRVEERPESLRSDQVFKPEELEDWGLEPGLPGFVRRFRAPEVPTGVLVAVQVRTDAPRGRFIDAGGAAQEKLVDLKDGKGQVIATEIHSLIWLDANRKTNSLTQFYDPIVLPAAETKDAKGGAK